MRAASRTLTAAAFSLLPVAAEAHNFAKGTFFPVFAQGVGASLNEPVALLTLIPVGLLASLWQTEGMLRIWPWQLAGLIVGVLVAIVSSPFFAIPALAGGLVCGILTVTDRQWPAVVPIGAAFVTGLLVNMVTLEGHGLGELPVGIYTGIVAGATAITAFSAAMARVLLEKFPYFWMRLGVRIVASWTVAMTLMYLTFQLRTLLVTS